MIEAADLNGDGEVDYEGMKKFFNYSNSKQLRQGKDLASHKYDYLKP